MSVACAASSTDWLRRFDSVWHVDFEFRQDADHRSVPVCMSAFDQHTGTDISLWGDQLRTLRRAPFGTGPRDLMVAYAANAELSCFAALGWPFPSNVLDLYVETIAAVNGRTDVWPPLDPLTGKPEKSSRRPGLLAALSLHGLEGMAVAEKNRMRGVILGHTDYSDDQRREIQDYNRIDVQETVALLGAMAPYIDVPRALHRGRFMAAIARVERIGLPVDVDALARLMSNWDRLQLHYIARDDDLGLYDGNHFRERRLEDLVAARGWDWPRTASGRIELSQKVLGQQARRYPELRKLVHLRNTIAELRISKLANTVGADGFSRCSLMPFWTKTGRNQPSERNGVFLPSLPKWLHGLLRPPPGYSLAELDWRAQEVAIMAGLSGDANMIADYRSGDPHWQFGVRAGLIPAGANKDAYKDIRQKVCKPVVLGQNYGMTPYGIAAKTGRSLLWARDIHARHRRIYPTFHRWLGDVVAQAKFDQRIESPYGWPMAVIAGTADRALMNFPAQAGGADAMRIATIAATEAGIEVCASVHDAFWIMAPSAEIDDAIATMRDIMMRAGAAVTGGLEVSVTVEAVVHWPDCLGDTWRRPGANGPAMWAEVWDLLNSNQLLQAGA